LNLFLPLTELLLLVVELFLKTVPAVEETAFIGGGTFLPFWNFSSR
jgi:hypothetical protein